MIEKELIFLDFFANDYNDFFDKISDILYEKGYVKETFKNAIKKREEEFPTGLQVESLGIAIPHTDSLHVNKPGIVFVRFDKSIVFKSMDGNGTVNVEMAFVLLVTDKNKQVPLLQKLMGLVVNNEVMNNLKIDKNENIIRILEEEL
ncbi:PTS sugar transporter subunit IIA [Clostridium perfringens]|uniref:PTS sugar transporter subunit IIA n=1 Tax=Clostridium perfringens TaxID=1502 RepID=A0AAE8K5Y7_CLOPF|nr:PTS sugar transporter subunit IIA [Clostridium perfringens]EHA1006080.1 PTS sugar transporter subunit IIA [Clostridium perfringens]EHA1009062.1 PTS sugar transporter subunit IIA [Clostridium perfringens]EHA1021373.1 PTS sugar transporter subunit IIA [Clostridium perfringens]EHA6440077.1 PTS sugar transporter subunit IIA [Clostridium perfringens]EHK2306184.1 PTS sugar transporter subunit IIA [Clostridium perfringens]